MERKYLAIIGVAIFVIAFIGGVYGYGYYANQKFEENFKLQYYNAVQAEKIWNQTLNTSSKTFNSKSAWEADKNNTIKMYNKMLDYQNKSIAYTEEMIKFAPSDDYKRYAEALLVTKKEALKAYENVGQALTLVKYEGITDQSKYTQLLKDANAHYENATKLSEDKDKIKLENQELNKKIEDLSKEADSVLQ